MRLSKPFVRFQHWDLLWLCLRACSNFAFGFVGHIWGWGCSGRNWDLLTYLSEVADATEVPCIREEKGRWLGVN